MRASSEGELLDLWERGRALHPLDKALLAVEALDESARAAEPADWPLGACNRALVEIREALFGRSIAGWTTCARCEEQLEFALDARALAETAAPAEGPFEVVGGRFRAPTSRDLAAIAREGANEDDPREGARRLAARCRINQAETDLGDDDLEAIGEAMAQADPLAEIRLHFDCPDCGAAFDESLDLADFLWVELEARARRILGDVHALADAYGWSEAEVLAISPARRAIYLEMAGG